MIHTIPASCIQAFNVEVSVPECSEWPYEPCASHQVQKESSMKCACAARTSRPKLSSDSSFVFSSQLVDIVLAALRAADASVHGGALLMLVDLLGKQNFMVEASLSALQLVTCLLACSASSSSQVNSNAAFPCIANYHSMMCCSMPVCVSHAYIIRGPSHTKEALGEASLLASTAQGAQESQAAEQRSAKSTG